MTGTKKAPEEFTDEFREFRKTQRPRQLPIQSGKCTCVKIKSAPF